MTEDLKTPSKEHGCDFKVKLGRNYIKEADKLSKKWNRRFVVYRCPHCGDAHLSKKLYKRGYYTTEALYITPIDLLNQ